MARRDLEENDTNRSNLPLGHVTPVMLNDCTNMRRCAAVLLTPKAFNVRPTDLAGY